MQRSLAYTLMVYTVDSLAACIQRGGVGWWTVGARPVDKIKYVIVTQKGGIDDKTAKFIIRVTGYQRHSTENRVLFTFDEYAKINVPDAMPVQQNPIAYVSVSDYGLCIEDLAWVNVNAVEVLPDSPNEQHASIVDFADLTIVQIKEGLARKFSVKPEAIEITVKH